MSNPFDLRFSMIQSAKELLTEQYHTDINNLKEKYYADKEAGLDVQFPEMPAFPTFEDISKLANEMNSFVSQR
jgi:hypothetical protein